VKSTSQRTVASVRRGRFSRNFQLSSGSQHLHTTAGKIKKTFRFYSKCICDWRVNNNNSNNNNEGETIEHIISSCTVLAQSEYKKRHDIFAKIIHMNLAVKFNLLKNTQPHYSYTPESCLENYSYKLYFDRTILTDIHIKHNRPDIIILNKQQKQAYLLDIQI
jgi:hypothetical protein